MTVLYIHPQVGCCYYYTILECTVIYELENSLENWKIYTPRNLAFFRVFNPIRGGLFFLKNLDIDVSDVLNHFADGCIGIRASK